MTKHRTVGDIMTRDVVTLYEEDNLERVRTELERYRFHHLPVVDGTTLVGMLSQYDLLRATVADGAPGPIARARQARILEETFVRDLMEVDVPTASESESIRAATARMLERGVGALPVVDASNNLIGIVTEHDVLRTLAVEEAD